MFSKQKNNLSFFYLHSFNQISITMVNVFFLVTRTKKERKSGETMVHSAVRQQQNEQVKALDREAETGISGLGKSLVLGEFPNLTNGIIMSCFVLSLLCSAYKCSPNSIHSAPLISPTAVHSSPSLLHLLPQFSSHHAQLDRDNSFLRGFSVSSLNTQTKGYDSKRKVWPLLHHYRVSGVRVSYWSLFPLPGT